MPKSPTRITQPKLSDLAKHVVMPSGVTSTGWPAVQAKCLDLGISFRPWQVGAGKLILAKRADGKYAATVGGTGMSIPRQVGKTYLVAAIVFALCLLRPGLTVLWTAHRLRTSEETFKKMQAFARRKRIAPHVKRVVLGSGEGAIEFHNGSSIMFGARERGFGRGFDEVDVLVFDEAQILTENALDDMVPAANQSRQPTGALQLFMGTPPKPSDPGEVFARMRDEALTGEDVDTGWIEFGADESFTPTPLPLPLSDEDWAQIEKANPSYPQDTPMEAILRMRKKLGPDSFLREGLGIWNAAKMGAAFGPEAWSRCRRDQAADVNLGAVGVAVARDLGTSALVAAGWAGDLVQVKPLQKSPGTAWVVARCKELQGAHDCDIVIDGGGPGAMLVPHFEQAGVRVTIAKTGDVLDSCATIYDLVREHKVSHDDYPELNAAVDSAKRRKVRDRWAWERTENAEPLEAMSLAAWALTKPDDRVSAYADHDLIVI